MKKTNRSIASVLVMLTLVSGGLAAEPVITSTGPNNICFEAQPAKFIRFMIHASSSGQPCIDEMEIYGPDGKDNLALASRGARVAVSSTLAGYSIHQAAHLNDGLYGNDHSWIASSTQDEWAQVELSEPAKVAKVVFARDRNGKYSDRVPVAFEIQLSMDGKEWKKVSEVKATAQVKARKIPAYVPPAALPDPITWDGLVRYAFLCEKATWLKMNTTDHLSPVVSDKPALPGGKSYWKMLASLGPVARVLLQMEEMIGRLEEKGLKLADEKKQLAELYRKRNELERAGNKDLAAEESLYLDARHAKRQIMLRDPDLSPIQRILFVKRHPYLSSHNYSDVLDSQFKSGGGIYVVEIPRRDGSLVPSDARLVTLFDGAAGIARDPMLDYKAEKVYFAYRPEKSPVEGMNPYWHLMVVDAKGGQAKQLTDGPFHDYYPCPLPDGGLSFISTRCRARFLCWRPQAFVLFRMDPDGNNVRPLSYANLSEWTPVVMRDGRIMWTRSEYVDKGADFGHTLWAIHPDGTVPELIFGNNTPNCYMNAREVPGSPELCCTIISHGGDHNGPIGLIDPRKGPYDSSAITSITPDVTPQYNMAWLRHECFRDPTPVSRDYFLVSHAPADRFGLYIIDRYGNRELLYLDTSVGSMTPSVFAPSVQPPALSPMVQQDMTTDMGQFTVADVYQGLEPLIQRGKVKYIRVCEEVRIKLDQMPNGEYSKDSQANGHGFQDYYATPIHKVNGPFGWPSYVAKAVHGLVTVEADGSANFMAPAGKVLYFEVLDANFNELQRMRSVIQLQPGERRSCVGCHENRRATPPVQLTLAAKKPPVALAPPSWGTGPFAYEKVVQPVLNAKCVRCHDSKHKSGINLTGELDKDRVPASYRTLISGGWVHHFSMVYGNRHSMTDPLSFGTLNSRLWKILNGGHNDVKLTDDETHRIKCWIDLNCPLWPDYIYRMDRPAEVAAATEKK